MNFGLVKGKHFEDSSYIFDIEQSSDLSYYVCSLSDFSVSLFSANFQEIQRMAIHKNKINCIECLSSSPHHFLSASDDKKIKMWDVRTPQAPVFEIKKSDEVLSVSTGLDGNLLASGSGSSIHFHDLRQIGSGVGKSVLAEYSDIHTDQITCIKFDSSRPSILASAAEDGLICLFDTTVAAGEEAVQSILNTECPVRRIGFFGPSNEGLFALSTVETATIWHYPSAQRLGNFNSIRESFGLDYLVDCIREPDSGHLDLIAGRYDGEGMLLRIDPTSVQPIAPLRGGHSASIRCSKLVSQPSAPSSWDILTGGEDSNLCRWSRPQTTTSTPSLPNSDFQLVGATDESDDDENFEMVASSHAKGKKKGSSRYRQKPF